VGCKLFAPAANAVSKSHPRSLRCVHRALDIAWIRACELASEYEVEMKECFFLIINFDGFNVGIVHDFSNTYLEFDNFEDAREIARHWEAFIYGDL
jgi:hypothetical protein